MIVVVLAMLAALIVGACIFAIKFIEAGSVAASAERAKREKTP